MVMCKLVHTLRLIQCTSRFFFKQRVQNLFTHDNLANTHPQNSKTALHIQSSCDIQLICKYSFGKNALNIAFQNVCYFTIQIYILKYT